MCINKKVIAGLVAAGVVVYLVAPGAIGAALPLLILAVCPLSMLVMMRAMSGGKTTSESPDSDRSAEIDELRTEVERLRAQQTSPQPLAPPAPRS